MKKDCDDNGSPYPAMKNGNGEFRITFSARTRESVAKLGIPPEKFGIGLTGEVAKNESEVAKKITETKAKVAENASAAEGARTESESAQTVAENAKTGAESAQTVAESAKTEVKIEALIDSFFTNPIRSDARRNMIAILDCLMRHPDNSATMVAKKLGLSQSATQKIMGTLRRAGLLRREGPDFGGYWVVNGLKEELMKTVEAGKQ